MDYLSVEFIVPPSHADVVAAVLAGLGILGAEETDTSEGVRIRACFPGNACADDIVGVLRDNGVEGTISLEKVEEKDWNASWRQSLQPVELVPGVWVSPPWRPPSLSSAEHWIRIEPAMAFGTGHHETTRLAARGIREAAGKIGPGGKLLDIGTGTGVLCFYAVLAGFAECLGVDIDKPCRSSMAVNMRENRAEGKVRLVIGEISCIRPGVLFDCVVMNMIFAEAAPLLPALVSRVTPDGLFVWSGILTEGKKEACAAATDAGAVMIGEFTEGEWWSGVFRHDESRAGRQSITRPHCPAPTARDHAAG